MFRPRLLTLTGNFTFLLNFAREKTKHNKKTTGQTIIMSYPTHWPPFTAKENHPHKN